MNILIPHSWLTEFVKTDAKPKQIADLLSLHSASVERIEEKEGDAMYDIEITGNRIDMAGIVGLAREVAAVLNRNDIPAEYVELTVSEPKEVSESLPITIKNDPNLCQRVLGVVIDGVQMKESPDWLKSRLEKSGIRSLNSIVDVTNYVMLETGYPTHVFDYDRIKTNTLIIRSSKEGENIVTFEGKTHRLPGGDIVIEDGTGEIIDLPGIAGTKNSVVTKNTERILFFTENNDPHRIRKTSMSLGIQTYAANINKNHPRPEMALTAFHRGIQLYQELCRGKISSRIVDHYEKSPDPKPITVSEEKLKTYIGSTITTEQIIRMITPLGFAVTDDPNNNHLTVTVPPWRFDDVTSEEDVIEEIARIHGYHTIKSRVLIGEPVPQSYTNKQQVIMNVKRALKYRGFTELYTSSLVSSDLLASYGFDPKQAVKLKNPLTEDGEYMRPSLVPGIMHAVGENKNRTEQLRLFELSRIYKMQTTHSTRAATPIQHNQPVSEPTMLTFVLHEPDLSKAFYEAKGVVEALFDELHVINFEIQVEVNQQGPVASHLHPTRQAEIRTGNKSIGLIGQLDDSILVDISVDELISHATAKKTYTPIPEHPPVIEDMTIELKSHTYIGPVMKSIRAASNSITNVVLVEQFNNSYTFRITFQDPGKNLSERDVEEIKKELLKSIK